MTIDIPATVTEFEWSEKLGKLRNLDALRKGVAQSENSDVARFRKLYRRAPERLEDLVESLQTKDLGQQKNLSESVGLLHGHWTTAGQLDEQSAQLVEVIVEAIARTGRGSAREPFEILSPFEIKPFLEAGEFREIGRVISGLDKERIDWTITVRDPDSDQSRFMHFAMRTYASLDPRHAFSALLQAGDEAAQLGSIEIRMRSRPAATLPKKRVQYLESISDTNVVATVLLAQYFADSAKYSIDSPNRPLMATNLLLEAIERGSISAPSVLAEQFYEGALQGIDETSVIELLEFQARPGDPWTGYVLGLIKAGRLGNRTPDVAAAQRALKTSIGYNDYARAEHLRLELPVTRNTRTVENQEEKIKSLEALGSAGVTNAAPHLATMHLTGCYVQANPAAAKPLLSSVQLMSTLREDVVEAVWLLATYPDDAVRDGYEAARLMEGVTESTNLALSKPRWWLVRAAEEAEAGNFLSAENHICEGLRIVGEDRSTKDQLLSARISFKSGEPLRSAPLIQCDEGSHIPV